MLLLLLYCLRNVTLKCNLVLGTISKKGVFNIVLLFKFFFFLFFFGVYLTLKILSFLKKEILLYWNEIQSEEFTDNDSYFPMDSLQGEEFGQRNLLERR